jgi:hypothetical protein
VSVVVVPVKPRRVVDGHLVEVRVRSTRRQLGEKVSIAGSMCSPWVCRFVVLGECILFIVVSSPVGLALFDHGVHIWCGAARRRINQFTAEVTPGCRPAVYIRASLAISSRRQREARWVNMNSSCGCDRPG